MGVTIMQFYTTLRIDKCKDLLTATDLPLSEIAQRFSTTVAELVRLNNIENPRLIYVGQVLDLGQC